MAINVIVDPMPVVSVHGVGVQGPPGATGPAGPQGAPGPAGPPGAPGSDASGDVVGPASATDNALALFDGTTGKLLKDSTIPASVVAQISKTNVFAPPQYFEQGGAAYGNFVVTGTLEADNQLRLVDGQQLIYFIKTTPTYREFKITQTDSNLVFSADTAPNAFSLDRAGNAAVQNSVAVGTNPAQSGAVRLANNQAIKARNAANTADIELIRVDASGQIFIGGVLYTP